MKVNEKVVKDEKKKKKRQNILNFKKDSLQRVSQVVNDERKRGNIAEEEHAPLKTSLKVKFEQKKWQGKNRRQFVS